MAQHIGVLVKKEGQKEYIADFNFADIFNLIESESDFKYVNMIQPYSDTIFLNHDIKYLLLDLGILNNKYMFNNYSLLEEQLKDAERITFIGD